MKCTLSGPDSVDPLYPFTIKKRRVYTLNESYNRPLFKLTELEKLIRGWTETLQLSNDELLYP